MNYIKRKSTSKVNKTETLKKVVDLKKHIRERFVNEYKTTTAGYNKKVVNDIIYNEKSQIVANFKEYLIFDDNSEFMKR
jgi:hypothetical protein